MRRHFSRLPILLFLVLALWGCQQQQATPDTPKQLKLLHQPLEPLLVELPGAAIPTWRESRAAKPALVLLSADPFLRPLPATLETDILQLVARGRAETWHQKATPQIADPLLLPQMTVTAALKAGLFSELIWVIPTTEEAQSLSVKTFAKQLSDYGALTPEEAAEVRFIDGVFTGTVYDTPFRAAPLAQLPTLAGPMVMHIDVSYFQPLYKGEIKTPLFPLIHDTLATLREKRFEVEAVTLSRSNLDGRLPLEVRFVGDAVATLLRSPEMLDQPLPVNWKRRADALYLGNFFQKEKVRELYLAMEQDAPRDASVQFDLYQIARQFKEGEKALAYLKRAVALDPVYGLEYMNLAPMATEKNRPEEALRMLDLAIQIFPEFPLLRLEKARYLINLKEYERARGIIDDLQTLKHSAVYYPGLPQVLSEIKKASQEGGQIEGGTN